MNRKNKQAVCTICQNNFIYSPWDCSRKFCSRKCYEISRRSKKENVCLECKKVFKFYEMPKRLVAKYCSKACYNLVRRKHTLKDVFEKNVIKTEAGCYSWKGQLYSNGYTSLTYLKKHYLGHRVAYQLYIGEIPEGMQVNHRCDVRSCTRPACLWIGSQQSNVDDMMKKGRNRCGEPKKGSKNHNAILNEEKVLEIRKLLREKTKTLKQIGEMFGVDKNTIGTIATNRSWKHVTLDSQ